MGGRNGSWFGFGRFLVDPTGLLDLLDLMDLADLANLAVLNSVVWSSCGFQLTGLVSIYLPIYWSLQLYNVLSLSSQKPSGGCGWANRSLLAPDILFQQAEWGLRLSNVFWFNDLAVFPKARCVDWAFDESLQLATYLRIYDNDSG